MDTFSVGVGMDGLYSNYSLLLDGTGDYVDCGTGLGTALGDNYAGSLTVSMWFKAGVTSGDDGMFEIGALAGAYGEINVSVASNSLRFKLNGGGWTRTATSFTDTTSWHHLVCVYATGSESNSKMYLDGIAVGSAADTFPAAADMDFAGLKTIIGAYSSSSYPFDGNIDECAIWDSALSAGQVLAIYNSGTPADLTSLSPVGWWRMGENNSGTGTTITDMGSGGNDGTLVGDPTFASAGPVVDTVFSIALTADSGGPVVLDTFSAAVTAV